MDQMQFDAMLKTMQTPNVVAQSRSNMRSGQNSGTPFTLGQFGNSGIQYEEGLTRTTEQNMDPASVAALQSLIQQLLSGGTAEQRASSEERSKEIVSNRDLRAGFTKDNAEFEANQAVQAQTRQAMEQSLAQLTKAVQGAGTSAGSMRALLTQLAARDAAESSAKLGLDAKVAYGGIAANFSQILEALTRPDNSITDSLIKALDVSKGVNASTTTQSFNRSQTVGAPASGGRSIGGGARSDLQLKPSQASYGIAGANMSGTNRESMGSTPLGMAGLNGVQIPGLGAQYGDTAGLWNSVMNSKKF